MLGAPRPGARRRKKGEEGGRGHNKETHGERGRLRVTEKNIHRAVWGRTLPPYGTQFTLLGNRNRVEACFFKYNPGTLYLRITWEPLTNADPSPPGRADSVPGWKIYRPGLLISSLGEVWAAAGGQAWRSLRGTPRAASVSVGMSLLAACRWAAGPAGHPPPP